MSLKTSDNQGLYLYAVVEGDSSPTNGLVGITGAHVYMISNGGGVSAVVSDVANQKIRPERRNLAAHQSVLKQLMTESTPLPMSFGIIADGPTAIKRILTLNKEAFREQFERVQGKVEMGLRVTWDAPNIFDYFVDTHPALRSARDRYFGTHREPTQEEKIELGRMFDIILNQDREDYAQDVVNVLSRHCAAIRQNKCRTEREVMNLACLVAREAEARFEAGILEAAGLFDNNFAFDYNGPWAPHNFVEIDLKY